nr:glycosyltransferase 87 family protein [Leifsonia psychrotolerans]
MMRSVTLWSGFVFVHAVLITLCLTAPGWPLGDVEGVYLPWAEHVAAGVAVPGITTDFVYPLLALVPIQAALVFGPALYSLAWLGLVTLVNAVAFLFLLRRRSTPRPARAAWWWLAFLLLLGPIALARIDAITVPLVIVALLGLRTRPLWGTVLLTLATWVKIWPVAALAALFVVSRMRWRVVAVAAGVSAFVVTIALAFGSGLTVFSFIGAQTSRGIQIESPIAGIWMWQAALHLPGSFVYYDTDILTFQVVGPGSAVVGNVLTPLLIIGVGLVLLVGGLAVRRGVAAEVLFPSLVLALVLTLITVNKVGSPQFITWLAAPVIVGLALHGVRWRTPAILALVLAGLTQLIYPFLYDLLLVANPLVVLVLTLRNLLEFVLLGWAIWSIVSARSDAPANPQAPRPDSSDLSHLSQQSPLTKE